MTYKPTKEQQDIIDDSKFEPKMKIKAFAGTGKTSTLIDVVKANPNKKFLNLCFNKSIATEANRKFPSNCESKTVHSLAYGGIVYGKYKGKVEVGNDFKF